MNSMELIKSTIISFIAEWWKKSGREVERIELLYPPQVERGDFALNFMSFKQGKEDKVDYVELARQCAAFLQDTGRFAAVATVGPYINITLPRNLLFQMVCRKSPQPVSVTHTAGTVVCEFSSPNTNKPLHLGHVRNNSLGTAMSNIMARAGYRTVRANLINDRGVHICKSMLAYQRWGNGSAPADAGVKGDHFVGQWYVRFNQELQNDPSLETEALALLQRFETGDPEVMELWRTMNGWVYDGFTETYYRYGVAFDRYYYESKTCQLGREIVEQGLADGVFYRDDNGAILCDLPPDIFGYNKDKQVKKVTLLRADGTSLYLTQDIGTAIMKHEQFGFAQSVYVVGSEQDEHFKYLFHILEKLGYGWAKDCYHLSYGMVLLPEGKMKSREGTVVDADNLLDEVTELLCAEIAERHTDDPLSREELRNRAETLANAAIKVLLLSASANVDVQFDPQKSIQFQGMTGVYLMYTYARACSIMRKAFALPYFQMDAPFGVLGNKEELEIARALMQYPESVARAAQQRDPVLVTRQLYEVAQAFNRFYTKHSVASADTPELRDARLELVKATAQVLKDGLNLLGIETVESI